MAIKWHLYPEKAFFWWKFGSQRVNWLSVKDKLLFNDLVMVHKYMKNLTPNYLSRIFHLRSEIHERNTRQKNDLNLPKYRLSAGQRSFAYREAKLYNNL